MAYTQKPGRGNNAKTGHGIPAPLKQYNSRGQNETTARRFENWDTNNPNFKLREYAEKAASMDSAAVANKAIKFGIGNREAKKMGSEAANTTRKNFGQGDLNVTVKTVPGGEEYKQKIKPGINPRTGAKVKVVSPAKMKMKKSPMKQTTSMSKKMDKPMAKGPKDTKTDKGMANGPEVKKASPAKMKVSKKTAYDIKEASNQKLKPSARKNYAENAQAAMKNKKSPAKMMDKNSPAKQLGRQAVTKMGGKKSPAKMGYGTPAKMKKC